MKVILAILFSALLARAEIRLEQIAEFQLPEGTIAWDVQHWMDDSTFGWVATDGQTIYYQTRLGDSTYSMSFGDTLCDPYDEGWYGYNVKALAAIRNASEDPQFAMLVNVLDWIAYDEQSYMVLWRGIEEECIWLGVPKCDEQVANYTVTNFYAWPPLPAVTSMVASAVEWGYNCEGTGRDLWESSGYARLWSIDNAYATIGIPKATSMDHYLGRGYEFAAWGKSHHVSLDDSPPYDHDIHIITNVMASIDENGLQLDTLCYERIDTNPDSGFSFHCPSLQGGVAAVDRHGSKRIFTDGSCYDGDSHELLWRNDEVDAQHVVCRGYPEGQVFLRQIGDRFTIHTLEDGRTIDQSQDILGVVKRVLDTGDCPNEIVTEETQGLVKTVRVYRLLPYENQLTISIASIGGQIILNWQPINSASGYNVCRNLDYSDDLCSGGDTYFTTDTTMVLTPWPGALHEYFKVVPVFE